jgi:hypothetical protein
MTDPDPTKEPTVTMTRSQYWNFLRNFTEHADQTRDLSLRYKKAKEEMLSLANEIECERPCSIWVERIREAFKSQ